MNVNNDLEKMGNEKQNLFTYEGHIRIQGSFPVLKQQFVKIKEVEYSTDFDFFLKNQVQVIVSNDNRCTICSTLEKRVFYKGPKNMDDASVFELMEVIHRDIISFKYGGELIY